MGKPAARLGDSTAHGGVIVVGCPTVLIGGKPAARITDMHTCPMQTPAPVPVPHVGGPILPPGVPTVLIGGLPAACVGDMCVCVGPPDSILPPGEPTVLIGSGGGGAGGGGGFGGGGGGGSGGGTSGSGRGATAEAESSASSEAEGEGGESDDHYLDVKFVDKGGRPIVGPGYHLEGPGDLAMDGSLRGRISQAGLQSGDVTIELKVITEAKWSQPSARDGETIQIKVSLDGIEDGTPAKIEIHERNLNTPDTLLQIIEDAEVSGGSLEVDWAYEYVDEEFAEEGSDEERPRFYSPSFFFKVWVAGCEAQSDLLEYRDFIEVYLKNDDEDAIADAEYLVFLSNGEVRSGQLDGDGYAKIEQVPPGPWSVEFPNHGSLEEL